MKKNAPSTQRLTRSNLIIGTLIVAVLLGFVAWRFYDNSQKSNVTTAEVDRSIDQQLLDQIAGRDLSEKGIGNDTSQQSATPPASGDTPQSSPSSPSSSSAPRPGGASAPSSGSSLQNTSPSTGGSPTSPAYPNDNGDTPQVVLTNPGSWKQIVSGSFTATATASDSSGINRVVFMLRKIGQAMPLQMITDTEAPYSAILNVSGLPNGDSDYTIEAQAFDNTAKGNLASYRINIQN